MPELPTGSVTVYEPPDPEVTGNTSGAGVSSLPKRRKIQENTKWTKTLNKLVIKCYLMSDPKKRGYRKRMLNIWKDIDVFELSEQKLAGQALAIRKNGWLSEIEIEEVNREIEGHQEDPEVEDVDVFPNIITQSEEAQENVENQENRWVKEHILRKMEEDNVGEDKIRLREKLLDQIQTKEDTNPPNLRSVDRRKVKEKTKAVDSIIHYIPITDLEEINNLRKAIAHVVARDLGIKTSGRKKTQVPWWKRRIEGQIKILRKEVSQLQYLKEEKLKSERTKKYLMDKYNIEERGLNLVLEELKERITAKAEKIKIYDRRVDQYQQNRMFQNNQRRLFEKLEGVERGDDAIPDAEESRKFWSNIWSKQVEHNTSAHWIQKIDDQTNKIAKQKEVKITVELIAKQARKLPNWKSPGPDGVHGFWYKNIKGDRQVLAAKLDQCLQNGLVPEWLTKGTTTLIMKDKNKGAEVTNYRPITCLPMMWKLLTGILSEEIYSHLAEKNLLPTEQKGCRKESRGTKDQLLIDRMIIQNCKRRQTGLAMAWIDYKKAFDMVPHSWILNQSINQI